MNFLFFCHYFRVKFPSSLNETQKATLEWLLRETFEPGQTSVSSFLSAQSSRPPPPPSTIDSEAGGLASLLVEVGPRLSFESAVSSNAKSICRASGVDGVTRFEVSPPPFCPQQGAGLLYYRQFSVGTYPPYCHKRMGILSYIGGGWKGIIVS